MTVLKPSRDTIIELCRTHGFQAVRMTSVGPTLRGSHYESWLDRGHHADMRWLSTSREKRLDPRTVMPGARTALALGVPYPSTRPPPPQGRMGLVARYAWGRDYHNLLGKALKKLTRDLRAEGLRTWGGVDTAPIIERSWASQSGLGVTGKNCVQFLPGQTSWMFLAVVFIDQEYVSDVPIRKDHCGSCRRCLDVCPTAAFDQAYTLDSRRCIAYWTIEAKDLPPRHLREGFGSWVFGCDLCQEVCPHNHDPDQPTHPDLSPKNPWLDLDWVMDTTDAQLMEHFLGTPLRRPGAAGLKRNALIALGNSGDPMAMDSVRKGQEHSSEVVRAIAAWASNQLGEEPCWAAADPSSLVRDEWAACLEEPGGPQASPTG